MMKKVLLENVRIGILDNNGVFRMCPLINNLQTLCKGQQSKKDFDSKVNLYKITDNKDDILVNIITPDGKEYIIQSFSDEYIEYLCQLYFSLTEFIYSCKRNKFSDGCTISDLSIITKTLGKETLFVPNVGLKLLGYGDVSGHKYLKGIGKTSKITNIDFDNSILKSKRSIYNILSLSNEYKKYLENIISDLELVLKRYSK
jgi:hypothetical protein